MQIYDEKIKLINEKAKIIRKATLDMGLAAGANGAHFAPTFSVAEILSTLFFGIMNHDPKRLDDANRDRFILSKGHAAIAYYVMLAESGYFSKEMLKTFEQKDSVLSGHPSRHPEIGIEFATGSLGHGLALGVGSALASRMDGIDNMTYVVCGDGETQEGSVWEAAMLAAQQGLENLTVIIDYNQMQSDGFTRDIINIDNMAERWKVFGWHVIEVNGHDVGQLLEGLHCRKRGVYKPRAIIAHTIKGKGVSFIENNRYWHHSRLDKSKYNEAVKELGFIPEDKEYR